jgi:hypothetical protein
MCLLLKIESPHMFLILYSLNSIFHKKSESEIKIDMQALVLNLLKIEIWVTSSGKRSKDLWMPQGSILRSRNLNLGPESQAAKNSKFLHVTRKNVIGPKTLQGLILYALNCPKLSGDPLKLCLLKSSNPCIHLSLTNAWKPSRL